MFGAQMIATMMARVASDACVVEKVGIVEMHYL